MEKEFDSLILELQKEFCDILIQYEDKYITKWKIQEDEKIINYILEDGNVFEKVVISSSTANGILPPDCLQSLKSRGKNISIKDSLPFYAIGINLVVHPKNPNVPGIYIKYHYFEAKNKDDPPTWWFGCSIDLIPYILNQIDCSIFHKSLKNTCDQYNTTYYDRFKKQCDEFYYIKHRGEHRGIGGIYFDDLCSSDKNKCFQFVNSCAKNAFYTYVKILENRKDAKYSYEDKEWKLLRRGRLVEFALLFDKETKFALFTPGLQCDNVLMTLPPYTRWESSYSSDLNSKEHKLIEILRKPRDWILTDV